MDTTRLTWGDVKQTCQKGTVVPTFDTPEPISVTIDIAVGDARIVASDRTDTIVEVSPSDGARESDVKAVERARVDYAGGRLLVKAAKQYRPFGDGGSIDVRIELPVGSHVRGNANSAALRCEGRLGECRFKSGLGDIQLDQTGTLHLDAGVGDIIVDRVEGHAEVFVGSGVVRIGKIDGTAVIKNTNGDIWVGVATGELRLSAANGDISVDQASAAVEAKAANGNIRMGEVVRGSVVLETGFGEVEVGIREGTAARLDLRTRLGGVRNFLDASDGPEPSDETADVRARTPTGDIVIRRS